MTNKTTEAASSARALNDPSRKNADKPAGADREKVNWWRELRGLIIMLLAVLGFHSFIAKPFYIPSISMMPTLLVGDRLVVSKFPYGWDWTSLSFHVMPRGTWRIAGKTPHYGDIVIVVPRNRKEDLIKRVVALPGDKIAVVNGQIVLNGHPVPQRAQPPLELNVDPDQPCSPENFPGMESKRPSGKSVCELPLYRETLPNGATYDIIDYEDQPLDHYPEITVPKGDVFLMGDDRDHSADSREPLWGNGLGGPVPLHDIGGRAEFLTFSLNGTETWNPLTWLHALRKGRAFTTLRPRIDKAAARAAYGMVTRPGVSLARTMHQMHDQTGGKSAPSAQVSRP